MDRSFNTRGGYEELYKIHLEAASFPRGPLLFWRNLATQSGCGKLHHRELIDVLSLLSTGIQTLSLCLPVITITNSPVVPVDLITLKMAGAHTAEVLRRLQPHLSEGLRKS